MKKKKKIDVFTQRLDAIVFFITFEFLMLNFLMIHKIKLGFIFSGSNRPWTCGPVNRDGYELGGLEKLYGEGVDGSDGSQKHRHASGLF